MPCFNAIFYWSFSEALLQRLALLLEERWMLVGLGSFISRKKRGGPLKEFYSVITKIHNILQALKIQDYFLDLLIVVYFQRGLETLSLPRILFPKPSFSEANELITVQLV